MSTRDPFGSTSRIARAEAGAGFYNYRPVANNNAMRKLQAVNAYDRYNPIPRTVAAPGSAAPNTPAASAAYYKKLGAANALDRYNPKPGTIKKKSSAPKRKVSAPAKKRAPVRVNVSRSVAKAPVGGSLAAAVVAPPVDPLEQVRLEISGYLDKLYGGLETSLGADRDQFKKNSDTLAAQLAANYGGAATQVEQSQAAQKASVDEQLARLGIQSATGTPQFAEAAQQQERIKQLGITDKSASTANFDLIRQNYYDMLANQVSASKGAGVQAQASLLDLITQARLGLQAAAASGGGGGGGGGGRGRSGGGGSRRRSSRGSSGGRRRSSGGGSRSSGGGGSSTSTVKSTSTNDLLNSFLTGGQGGTTAQMISQSLIKGNPVANRLIMERDKARKANANKGTERSAEKPRGTADAARDAANIYMMLGGFYGGPKQATTTTYR